MTIKHEDIIYERTSVEQEFAACAARFGLRTGQITGVLDVTTVISGTPHHNRGVLYHPDNDDTLMCDRKHVDVNQLALALKVKPETLFFIRYQGMEDVREPNTVIHKIDENNFEIIELLAQGKDPEDTILPYGDLFALVDYQIGKIGFATRTFVSRISRISSGTPPKSVKSCSLAVLNFDFSFAYTPKVALGIGHTQQEYVIETLTRKERN